MVFNPTHPDNDVDALVTCCSWKEFCSNVQEPVPVNAPPPLGEEVDLHLLTGSDHACNQCTQCSQTGFFMNSAQINWMLKKQPAVETPVFGAGFVALRHRMKVLRGLRCKLRMMGISTAEPPLSAVVMCQSSTTCNVLSQPRGRS